MGGRGRSDCQGHNCKVVIKKKQSAIWKWDLDDFSHAGWVSLVKGYNRVEVKGKGRICGKREDTTPKVKYYKKKGLSHTAPFPFLSFPFQNTPEGVGGNSFKHVHINYLV